MGLTLSAVSKGYHYSKLKGDVVGKEYLSTDIGYFGFKFFRDALLKFASDGVYSDIAKDTLKGKEFTWCWYKDDTMAVIMRRDEFEEGDKVDEDYLNKLEYLKVNYPKVYAIYPLLAHCDCEGEMPLNQCKMILPVIKEFYKQDNHNYGYSGWDYNFTEEFINILETVIQKKGKLYFH